MACLWRLSVLVFDNKSLITGVILDASLSDEPKSGKTSAMEIMKTYFRQPLVHTAVTLKIGEETYQTTTDDHGSFSIDLDRQVHEEVHVFLTINSVKLEPIQNYPYYFGPENGKLHVISDIDDTVIVSHTSSLIKRIKTLFTPVSKRRKVDFTQSLISDLIFDGGRVCYVSKSENNLFRMLSSFISEHSLPVGHLFLTPYLRFGQLLNPKKGKAFKLDCIKYILDQSGNTYFVLIGDDTQRDLEVYYEIAGLYPGQIVKIYIRNTGKGLLGRKKQLIAKLAEQKIPCMYYTDTDSSEREVELIKQLMKSFQ